MPVPLRVLVLYLARPLGLAPIVYSKQDLRWRMSRPWRVYSVLVGGAGIVGILSYAGSHIAERQLSMKLHSAAAVGMVTAAVSQTTWLVGAVWRCAVLHAGLLRLATSPRLNLLQGRLRPLATVCLAGGLFSVATRLSFLFVALELPLLVLISLQSLSRLVEAILFTHVSEVIAERSAHINKRLLSLKMNPSFLGADVVRILSLRRQYIDLVELTELTGWSFGVCLLTGATHSVWMMLYLFFHAYHANMKGLESLTITQWLSAFLTCLRILYLGIKLLASDRLHKRARETLHICYVLLDSGSLASAENDEIRIFCAELYHRPLRMTACGLVTFSVKHILQIFSGAFAYFIIVLQFFSEG